MATFSVDLMVLQEDCNWGMEVGESRNVNPMQARIVKDQETGGGRVCRPVCQGEKARSYLR